MSKIDYKHISVERNGRVLAVAEVRTDAEHNVVSASLHVEAGHLPMGIRTQLVDDFLAQTDALPGALLQVALPAGDGEILDRMRQRCGHIDTRAAGATCLAAAHLPKL
jgi:hypothetical protein